jgi:ubiquinone/menaquinone biosynthesis C-methylase UbiE
VAVLRAELSLAAGARVLDLGAGTGKLSRALVDAGLDVIAVEPMPELRRLLKARIGADRVHSGSAEMIPLPDESVDGVTVADAFHWFDQAAAAAEIARVLRPGGGLAVLSMAPDWRNASWGHDLGQLLSGLRPEHPFFDGPPWHAAVPVAGGWTRARELIVTTHEPTSPARVVDHISSMSWMAALPDARREEVIAEVRELVHAGATPARAPQHVRIGLVQKSAQPRGRL